MSRVPEGLYRASQRTYADEKARADRLEKKYRRLVHAVWHALDDSEHRVGENEVVIGKKDYDRLSKLVPEAHP